jgi:NTE family protein
VRPVAKRLPSLMVIFALLAAGCAHRTWNEPLAQPGPASPYDFSTRLPANAEDVFVVLAFSGGGTRSAAFAYGVLEKLRDTMVAVHGRPRRLLDEVDVITAVSGGSYPAAYYGLFGDRLFRDFEADFLLRDVQGELLWLLARPSSLLTIMRGDHNRADLAAAYFDRNLFDGRRFADLALDGLPFVIINASDLNNSATFSFIQPQFDFLCSDLGPYPVANAVMASSSVPGAFAPVALRNYPDCPQRHPAWVAEALATDDVLERRYAVARALERYSRPDQMPILRLVDGGVTDNLGVRGSMMSPVAHSGDVPAMAGAFTRGQLEKVRHVLVIVANAQTYSEYGWSRDGRDPGLSSNVRASFDAALGILNTETAGLAKQGFLMWEQHVNNRRGASTPHVKVHFVVLTFNQIRGDEERLRFDSMPTRLRLAPENVAAVRSLAGRLLDESAEYRSFLDALEEPVAR